MGRPSGMVFFFVCFFPPRDLVLLSRFFKLQKRKNTREILERKKLTERGAANEPKEKMIHACA